MLKRYSDLCMLLSFVLLVGRSQIWANELEFDNNAEFIEQAVTELADSILAELPYEPCPSWLVRFQARNAGEDVLYFIRNAFLITAKHKFPNVDFFLAQSTSREEGERQPVCTIDLVLTDWRFRVFEIPGKDKKFRYVQDFELGIELIVADARGAVQRADKIDFSRQRKVPNRKALERAQENQPDFAKVEKMPAAGKKDLISGLLITAVTGLTIFLLFQFRSQ